MVYAASGIFEADRIPQDMLTGIIVTLIGLVILFSFKPRLKIELRGSGDNPIFLVRNRGIVQVIGAFRRDICPFRCLGVRAGIRQSLRYGA